MADLDDVAPGAALRNPDAPTSEVDWFSDKVVHDPYPVFQRWRDEIPLWWSDNLKGYVVSRYDDVRMVLGNVKTFHQSEPFEAALVDAFDTQTLLSLNPPAHTELRKPAVDYFRPSKLRDSLASVVEAAVDDLVAEVAERKTVELSRDVTTPLVMTVMSALMGADDVHTLKGVYVACMEYVKNARLGIATPEVRERGKLAGSELMTYLDTLRIQRLSHPGKDLLSELAPTSIKTENLLGLCAVVLFAGVETTVRGIANTFYALLTGSPEHRDKVRDGELAGGEVFEEGLRWIAPLSLKARQVREEVTIHGVTIAEGSQIYTSIGSANRDSRHFDDAETFRPGRRAVDHLAFGSGVHYCLGASLARIEGGTLVASMLKKFPDLRLDSAHPIEFDGPVYRSPRELWMTV